MAFLQQFASQGSCVCGLDDLAVQGTVKPAPQFSASGDAEVLDKAIKVKGVDEVTIIEVLAKRSNQQRQQIKAAYQQAAGKPLDAALKSALSAELEDVVLALLRTPAQYDAQQLKVAMKGLGTDEDTLVEILASRTNSQIRELKKAYKDGKFVCMLNFKQRICALYEAGEKRKGTDCTVFIDILTSRSAAQLRKVFQLYSKYSKVDVAKAVDLELKGDIENLLVAVVKCAGSKPAYFAEKLNLAMKGSGYKGKILTRILVSRSEVDLVQIKQEYKKKYGKTLYKDILDDTKGDYEKILLTLVGSDE
uniref:Annexin n=1 Tax=Pygocentrus nattereri TaxID=42514 RepID=A0AAR2ILV2_PYGNA